MSSATTSKETSMSELTGPRALVTTTSRGIGEPAGPIPPKFKFNGRKCTYENS